MKNPFGRKNSKVKSPDSCRETCQNGSLEHYPPTSHHNLSHLSQGQPQIQHHNQHYNQHPQSYSQHLFSPNVHVYTNQTAVPTCQPIAPSNAIQWSQHQQYQQYQQMLQAPQQSFAYSIHGQQYAFRNSTVEMRLPDNQAITMNTQTQPILSPQIMPIPTCPNGQNQQQQQNTAVDGQPPRYASNPHYSNHFQAVVVQSQQQPQQYHNLQHLNQTINSTDVSLNQQSHQTKSPNQQDKSHIQTEEHQSYQNSQATHTSSDRDTDLSLDVLYMMYEKGKENLTRLAGVLKSDLEKLTSDIEKIQKGPPLCEVDEEFEI